MSNNSQSQPMKTLREMNKTHFTEINSLSVWLFYGFTMLFRRKPPLSPKYHQPSTRVGSKEHVSQNVMGTSE